MHRSLSCAATLCLALFVCGPLAAEDEAQPTPQEAALAVTKAYVAKLQEKDPKAGLESCWSFDGMCQGIFGAHYTKMSKEAQEETARTIFEVLLPTMTSPEVADLMSRATYDGFEAQEPKDGKVRVTFTVTMPGMQPAKQFYWLREIEGSYKVVDVANGMPEQAISKALARQYEQHAAEATPLDFVRLMKR